MSAGRIEWSFKLEWISGGEEWLVAPTDNGVDYLRPWWDPPESTKALEAPAQTAPQPELTLIYLDELPTQMQQLEISPPTDPLVDPNDHWQSRYQVEKVSHNIWDRLGDIYYSQVSSHFVAAFGTHIMPSGWYCVKCGKLNFQTMFRHRRCSSSVCKVRYPFSNHFDSNSNF